MCNLNTLTAPNKAKQSKGKQFQTLLSEKEMVLPYMYTLFQCVHVVTSGKLGLLKWKIKCNFCAFRDQITISSSYKFSHALFRDEWQFIEFTEIIKLIHIRQSCQLLRDWNRDTMNTKVLLLTSLWLLFEHWRGKRLTRPITSQHAWVTG